MDDWSRLLGPEKTQPYFQDLMAFIDQERRNGKVIYPPQPHIFRAFKLTTPGNLKVVILGQDPYHGADQAMGLAFSVNKQQSLPPSLKNIYKELARDLSIEQPNHGDLSSWAAQGVLLLNTVLTVEANKAHSHKNQGWERFTDSAISAINNVPQHVVFLLWGSHAQKKASLIDQQKHSILTAPHPSPLSAHRGFLGCSHFSQANLKLQQHQQTPIQWAIN